MIQKLEKEKKEANLHLKIYYNKEMGLKKKKTATELPLIKLTFYNTTTKKQEEVEFYDYMMHFEKFGFSLVENDLELRYLMNY